MEYSTPWHHVDPPERDSAAGPDTRGVLRSLAVDGTLLSFWEPKLLTRLLSGHSCGEREL